MALKPLKPSKQKRKDSKQPVPALLQPKPVQQQRPLQPMCRILNFPD